ncbi:MAG: VWA domain-containing protein [Planctomycetes bacterium]|nr:VWA domain-containing protein [Planctomycetota bacterium]
MFCFLAQVLPSFIAPGLAVAGLAAVSVPIIIHILSRRPRKPVEWAAMRFVLAAYKRHRMRTRLEQLLLLLMRCLILAVLGLALAGPIWSALGAMAGLAKSGRVVVIVLDNSLTSAAAESPGKSRYDELRGAAGKLLDELTAQDRVALITASRPAAAIIAPPTSDPMAVRRQIDMLGPTAAAADLRGALQLAQQTLDEMEQTGRPTYVVLLSDFSAGAVPLEAGSSTLPKEISRLGEKAKLLMYTPAAGADNIQIQSIEPDRKVVIAGGATGATPVSWSIKVRRFTQSAGGPAVSTVRLSAPGQPPVRREVRWAAGQNIADLHMDTPLATPGTAEVEAMLEPAAEGSDVLDTDNTMRAIVRVRQKLGVTILDRVGTASMGLSPAKWLSTALAPVADQLGWPIHVKDADTAALGADRTILRDTDAVLVLRPDLLDDAGWDTLGTWTKAGGLAWIIAPPTPTPTLWPAKLNETMGLNWSIGAEAVKDEPPLRLASDTQIAEELVRLRSDIEDLLRPVEIYRHLPIETASLGAQTSVLLKGAGGQPIMIAADTASGRGRVMLTSTAVDLNWTNLPIKPLFVPLVHEVIRAAIDQLQPAGHFEAGDQPRLGPAWADVTKLIGPGDTQVMLIKDSDTDSAGGEGVTPIRPLLLPGVYRSETDALVVNVRPDAGNTLAVDRAALRSYLGAAGEWNMIHAADPSASLRIDADRADLSWPLLWAVLALAIGEMVLARYASHASTKHRTHDVTSIIDKPVI